MKTKLIHSAFFQLITFPLLILIIFQSGKLSAQSIDTVCTGTMGKAYSVTAVTGSTYNWIITGGTQASGTTTNAITVNWGNTAGLYSIKVVQTSVNGCVADTVSLSVRILPVPTAALAGNSSRCYADAAGQLTVTFTGVGPFNFSYTNGSVTTSVTNISANPYSFTPSPAATVPAAGAAAITTTYSLVSVSGKKSCAGTVSGTAAVTVYSKPVTSAISF